MPAPDILDALRVVATPASLDDAVWPPGTRVLRIAPDEALVVGATEVAVDDPHAIVVTEHGYAGVEMERPRVEEWLHRNAEWRLPSGRPTFAQGMAAGLPVKIHADDQRAVVVVWTSLMKELTERL